MGGKKFVLMLLAFTLIVSMIPFVDAVSDPVWCANNCGSDYCDDHFDEDCMTDCCCEKVVKCNCGENNKDCQWYCGTECTPTCTNEAGCTSSGLKQCLSTTTYKTCGNYDADSCLEWSTSTSCAAGQICENGNCITPKYKCSVPSYTCSRDDSFGTYTTSNCDGNCCDSSICVSGQTKCSTGTTYQECGNYDTDNCLEWSASKACAADETCSGDRCIKKTYSCSATYQCDLIYDGSGEYATYDSCDAACNAPFCGDGIINQEAEECDGSTKGCDLYPQGCSADCKCVYFQGNITLSTTTPCVNKLDTSRDILISGENNYCGDLDLKVYLADDGDELWAVTESINEVIYPSLYSVTLNIPLNIISLQKEVSKPILIEVRGSRDLPECNIDAAPITIKYDVFNYCPHYQDTEETYPDYWTYGPGNYTFYNNGIEYNWDNCISDLDDQRCNLNPTSCVFNSESYLQNRVADVDSDGSKELCYSKFGLQGGWIDPDVNRTICEAASIPTQNNLDTLWFSCAQGQPYLIEQCRLGKDTFAPAVAGLCCGDDTGEYPTESVMYMEEDFGIDPPLPIIESNPDPTDFEPVEAELEIIEPINWDYTRYKSCCSSATSCVDENSICRPNRYESCNYDVQALATCDNGNWILTRDDECKNNCEECDINHDGWVNSIDLTAIQNHFTTDSMPYDSTYDTNGDNIVDTADYTYCEPLERTACVYCGNNMTEPYEGCDIVKDEVSFNCPAEMCGSDIGKPLPNALYTREDTCTAICGCIYSEPTCSPDKCEGSCATDADCLEGFSCNTDTCSCEEKTRYGCSEDQCIEITGEFTGTTYYSSDCDDECVIVPCEITEEIEVTLDDNIDNDCDGLIDEPIFYNGYGVYIWEQDCNYNLCAYTSEAIDYTTKANENTENSVFYSIRGNDLEEIDFYTLSDSNKRINFTSKIYRDTDCIVFKADEVVRYDIDMNGSRDPSNMYLTQERTNPLGDPFYFASPECAKECDSPDECSTEGTLFLLPIDEGCSYQRCIFDCGGYWIDDTSIQYNIFDWSEMNYGDSCADCQEDMVCSNYTNIQSCNYDPCDASSTQEGCVWNSTTKTCGDAFTQCPTGTTKCLDGTCSSDCEEDDTMNAICIGLPNDICELGEGCGCIDCYLEQDSCVQGAICGADELCGCRTNTTLCNDGTCDETCEDNGGAKGCIGLPDKYCAAGEGCACIDCNGLQDSCVDGAVCNSFFAKCEDSIITDRCDDGETLCNDWTCDDTCEENGGKAGCIGIANKKCEPGEGCACSDCHNKQDSCKTGSYCNYEYQLCERTATEVVPERECIDDDSDGYYDLSTLCPGSDDCNDASSSIHPGALELCNNIDDNCNGQIDENCKSEQTNGLILSIKNSGNIRVLDRFKLSLQIKNNLPNIASDVIVRLDVPKKFEVYKSTVNLGNLNPGETKDVTFELLVKDYPSDIAVLNVNALISGSNAASQELFLNVEHPEFLIAAEPMFEYDTVNKNICLNFYYSLNNKNYETMDVEFEIVDPSSIFGKSVIVDYVSSIRPETNLVRPMLSNPYCLQKGNYEIHGYLYSSGALKLVNQVDESTTYLDLR